MTALFSFFPCARDRVAGLGYKEISGIYNECKKLPVIDQLASVWPRCATWAPLFPWFAAIPSKHLLMACHGSPLIHGIQ
jgi:hypothetical protein